MVPRGGETVAQAPVAVDPANIVASDNSRHLVALLLPISGPDGDVGQSIANATMLALLDTKNSNIRITTYDTALGANAAAQKAIADGNKLILGPLRSDDVVSVADVAQTAHIPVISFSNDIGAAGPDIFLLGHLPNQSIDRVVRYAKAQGITNFGAIVSKTVYGQRAASTLAVSVRSAGGNLVNVQEYDGTKASMDMATRKLAVVDAILIADNGKVAMAAIPSIRAHGNANARILGTDLWSLDNSLSASTAMRGAWFAGASDVMYKGYANEYRTRFGKAPLRISSLGYDSALLVARIAQSWKVGTAFPVAKLIAPDGFAGIDGAFRFLPTGMSERTLEVKEIQAGQFATIDPAPTGF